MCRACKGILDPKKLDVIDTIIFAGTSNSDELEMLSPGVDQTKSGRAQFKTELMKRYCSKYRDADNRELLMGEQMPLGRAYGILAVCRFRPCLKVQACRSIADLEECSQILLERDQHQSRFEWPNQKALVIYMQGLLTTALVCVQTDLPDSAPVFGQQTCIRDQETQLHLDLGPTQTAMQ